MPEDEMIEVIDEQEHLIKTIPKSEVRKENLLRKGADVFIFDNKGNILIHQRASVKIVSPNAWDIFLGGWVLAGESFEQAAHREVEEEIGAENISLTFLFKCRFNYKSQHNDLSYVYKGVYNEKIIPQADEVQAFEWIPIKNIRTIMKQKLFSPKSQFLFNKYSQYITGEKDD